MSAKNFSAEAAATERQLSRWSQKTSLSFGRGKDLCGQATKGVWGMSWRQVAMKGVEGCEKPGEAVKQALIPGFPNYRMLNP